MEKSKITANSDNIFQIKQGDTYDIVVDGDKIYVHVMTMPGLTASGGKAGKAKPVAAEDEEEEPAKGKGKAGGGKEKPAAAAKDEDQWDKVEKHLVAFDKGVLNEAKAVARITDDSDLEEETVRTVIRKMNKNSKFTVEDAMTHLKGDEEGEAEEEKPKKKPRGKAAPEAEEDEEKPRRTPAKGKGKAAESEEEGEEEDDDAEEPIEGQPKGEVIKDWADLEVGDRVAVYWDTSKYQEWYKGAVSSKGRGGKVYIKYDDESEEALNKEAHTRVVRTKKA